MKGGALRKQVEVVVGKSAQQVGTLLYVKDGAREYSTFSYADSWLADASTRFQVSPELPLDAGYVHRKGTRDDSCFPFALADTAPDAWGRRVIARAHARARTADPKLGALTELDYLCAVSDVSRVGALRLSDGKGRFLGDGEYGRNTPPLVELGRIYEASRAVEKGSESAADLKYLQGKGTSLGGMRPKCTIVDADGSLALGKFPSLQDERSVTRGEVLALVLAGKAGVEAANARIMNVDGTPIAVIKRFDRTADGGRIHYLSGASLLQASRTEDRSYAEIADAIRSVSTRPTEDAAQLWRRLVFNFLITNVDDHLQNIGFLYAGSALWRLSPAFDINPFPDKDRESKTWLNQEDGPIRSMSMLLNGAAYFGLSAEQAREVLGEVVTALRAWREVAKSPTVGMSEAELADFEAAFEHKDLEEAAKLLR